MYMHVRYTAHVRLPNLYKVRMQYALYLYTVLYVGTHAVIHGHSIPVRTKASVRHAMQE